MASKIVVTESEINSIVSTFQTEHDSITDYKTSLIKELEGVNSAWKGADATKYTSKMHDDYSVLLDQYSAALQSRIDFLKNVYSEYSSFDQAQAGRGIDI